MNRSILITGSNGFIGDALFRYLKDLQLKGRDIEILGAVRSNNQKYSVDRGYYAVGNIDKNTNWRLALANIDVVVHLAGRAHIVNDNSQDPLHEFRLINVESTVNLAKQALEMGVKRFIFISSIGVNGAISEKEAYTENHPENPSGAYAISKYEAECALKKFFKGTNVELVIIRPPMVYGSNAPGNFARLCHFIRHGALIPFGLVKNSRSFISILNLTNFIAHCLVHPNAANEVFLVSDDQNLSTAQFVKKIADAKGVKIFLLPVPVVILKYASIFFKKKEVFEKIFGNLEIDITKSKERLGWRPKFSVEDSLSR